MKKHFLKISALACAAVVSACAVTASAASVGDSSLFAESGKEAEHYADPKYTVAPYMIETTESGLTVFEEALLAGDYSLGCGTVECAGNHNHPAPNTDEDKRQSAAAESGTEITFEEVEDVAYDLWSGRYTLCDNLNTFEWYSTTPNCFEISGDSRKITMHAYDKYYTLYKRVAVRLTYLNEGKITYVTPPVVEGTTRDIVVTADSAKGELVEIAAYCYIYDASTSETGFREVAVVHILNKYYAPLAIKNGAPYAHLLDTYTPI